MVDISNVSATWNNTSWLFGLSETFHSISMAPNSAALLRVLWMGEMEVVVWELNTLVTALKAIEKKCGSIDELKETLASLRDSDVQQMSDCPGYYTTMVPEMVYYIPCGWVVCERVKAGPLIYGCRKSIFFKTGSSVKNYAMAKELMSAANLDVTKMDSIMDCLQ